ncbi:MAG: glycoside hydrolase domain-containing protein [Planctomycetota bacterium]|jgi:hypothetical protein
MRFTVILALATGMAASAASAGEADVLNMKSFVRWHVTHRAPLMLKSEGGKETEPIPYRGDNSNFRGCDADHTAAPPAGWTKPAFDDSAWPRTAGEWMGRAQGRKLSQAVLSVRAKFNAAGTSGGLSVTVKYRGGVRVFLNGREIARGHLPEGDLEPETAAEVYSKDAYLDAKGEIINQRGGRIAEADKPRVASRDRTLGPVKLPADALKRGVNVLAIEVRRANYHPAVRKWWKYPTETRKYPWWRTGDLLDFRLSGGGATPNVARPAGVQVWVQDRNDRVYGRDHADPNEPLAKYPLRLVGARNGYVCGQVVVGSNAPLRGVKAAAGDLKALEGGGTIPAKSISLLYALPIDSRNVGRWFRDLTPTPPAEAAVKGTEGALQPVLVGVQVPKDAAPGEYRGEVTVSAGGKSVKVPVELYVAGWTVPDPRDFRTYMGVYQSPTTVAMQYRVKLWSDEHFKRMEKSWDLLARAGNKMVNVPVVDETQFGNPEGMIYWVKKADGSYDYDFSIFDRYLKMATDRIGKQDYVCLQVWHAGGWSARGVDNKCTVQVLEEKTGKRAPMQVPLWGKPEAVAFWKPFLAAMQARLEKLDMPEAMCVGILSDSTAPNEVFKTLSDAFPGGQARWHRGCHGTTRSPKPYKVSKVGNNVVSLHEHCYGMSLVRPKEWQLPVHTQRGWPGTAYFRVSNHIHNTGWHHARTMSERALWTKKQGLGRICLDFWPVMKGKRNRTVDIYNRYPHSSCAQREPSLKSMTWPAPDGAGSTLRYEALVEGLSEAEAFIAVSEGLAVHKARLGAKLAGECEKVLADRLAFLWACTRNTRGHFHTYHYGWQDLNRRLFDCAAAVAEKTGKK